jgi:hypothetical protein
VLEDTYSHVDMMAHFKLQRTIRSAMYYYVVSVYEIYLNLVTVTFVWKRNVIPVLENFLTRCGKLFFEWLYFNFRRILYIRLELKKNIYTEKIK